MSKEPFSKYFLCNFNDSIQPAELPRAELVRLWRCEWSKERLSATIDAWQQCPRGKQLSLEEAETLLCDAIELTLIFVQHNFTGPFTDLAEFSALLAAKALQDYDPFVRLMENGEELNPNVRLGELLVIAKEMFALLLQQWPESLVLKWWQLRLVCLQQQLIDELTSNLYAQVKTLGDYFQAHWETAFRADELEYVGLLHVELANAFLLFHRTQKSEELLAQLYERLDLELLVEGLLGLRTKFQQKALPQLCLKVIQRTEGQLPSSAHTNGSTELPKLLLLDDDTRLERIRFISPQDNEVMSLPSVLQAVVLAKVKLLKRAQPKDRLADEELEPFIQTLLYQQKGPLQVRQSALLLNCIQESTQRRTVERSWKQCEEAVRLLDDTHYTLAERLSYGFAGCLQPKWQVQLQLCELLVSLGMTKTALDIYLKVQAWEQVIECYTRLELRHKAAEIIRQELEKKPTVLLHCLLGDATDDPACYAAAWEFSKQSSGRAQAHWGNYYFRRHEYEEAVVHLEKSVEINSLQEKIWLRLGYAAISLERWELAVHSYITYTHLEPLGFESWNNLAKALIKLGDKQRAHRVLSESLKCNYNNWKVWENFMVVSVDTGHFEDAMNAYNRLSELREHYLDLEVLCITMNAIASGKPDAKGQTPERLHKKAVALLGHQCVRHGNEPRVWELAALLATTPLNKAQKLVKAFRAHTAKELAWATKQQVAYKALQLCRELCERSLEAINEHAEDESDALITSQLHSARLSAQACLRAIEKETQQFAENQSEVAEVRRLQDEITLQLKQRMGVE